MVNYDIRSYGIASEFDLDRPGHGLFPDLDVAPTSVWPSGVYILAIPDYAGLHASVVVPHHLRQ
jgi:hypothetical protein